MNTVEENATRMSTREFNAYYGIKTDEDREDFVRKNSTFSSNDPTKMAAIVEHDYEEGISIHMWRVTRLL